MINFLVSLILILLLTAIFGSLANKIGQPKVVGQMLSGVFLGPTILGNLYPDFFNIIEENIEHSLYYLGQLGLGFYMFLMGTELKRKPLPKEDVKVGLVLALSGIFVMFFIGFFFSYILYDYYPMSTINKEYFALFMASGLSLTAFPMLAKILEEKNAINSSFGKISLFAASIDDAIAWLLLAIVISIITRDSVYFIFIVLISLMIYILFMFKVLKKVLEKFVIQVSTEIKFLITVCLVILSMILTNLMGLHAIFGGIIAGLILPKSFEKEVMPELRNGINVILLPVFFVYAGLTVNLWHIFFSSLWVPLIVYIVISIVGKYGAVTLVARGNGLTWKDSSAMGALMNARGLMILIFGSVGLEQGIIEENVFAILVFIALITTGMTYPLFNLSFPSKSRGEEKGQFIKNEHYDSCKKSNNNKL